MSAGSQVEGRTDQRWLARAALLMAAAAVVALVASTYLFLLALALIAGRAALRPDEEQAWMPERDAPPRRHPFIVMNPRSAAARWGGSG